MYISMLTLNTLTGVPNFGRTESSRNGITIEWDPADSPNCGPVLYYNVTIVNSVNANDMNTTQLSVTRIEFCNLINGTSYNISVAAVNRAGTGPSITTTVATLTDDEGKHFTYVYMYKKYMSLPYV